MIRIYRRSTDAVALLSPSKACDVIMQRLTPITIGGLHVCYRLRWLLNHVPQDGSSTPLLGSAHTENSTGKDPSKKRKKKKNGKKTQ